MSEYIDRDAVCYQLEKQESIDGQPRAIRRARRIVADFPAADVRPVVHGQWIKSPECPEEYDICSVCGKNDKHRSRGNWEHDMVESVPPFCKWCGARMDGDGDV